MRVVPPREDAGRRVGIASRRSMAPILAVAMVVAALLIVVIGNSLLANGQVRMSSIEHQLVLEQAAHRQAELQVGQLEVPSRIVGAAMGSGMVHPTQVTVLPYVPLTTPLPPPKVTPAPVPTATPPTQTPTQ